MTNAQEYVAENAQYMADKTQVEALAGLTDAEFESVLDASSALGLGDGDPGEIIFTRETLGDWQISRQGWSERGEVSSIIFGGFDALHFEHFQMFKGQTRQSGLVVINLGDRRVVVS